MDKNKTCCFTGHREIKWADYRMIVDILLSAMEDAVDAEYENFICGGARGFDALAAETVLFFKRSYIPTPRLVLMLPFRGQEETWCQRDQDQYRRILNEADEVIWIQEEYSKDCFFRRNRAMVDASSRCISYYDHRKDGGTAYTYHYAEKQGLDICDEVYDDVLLRKQLLKIGAL